MLEKKEVAIEENEINDIRKKLESKVHLTTSTDGAVTIQYNGTGEYKNISINVDLKTIDKDVLEKDILDLIEYSKNQMQADLAEVMMSFQNKVFSNDNQEEDYTEDRRDVS